MTAAAARFLRHQNVQGRSGCDRITHECTREKTGLRRTSSRRMPRKCENRLRGHLPCSPTEGRVSLGYAIDDDWMLLEGAHDQQMWMIECA
jgi:hypothetical protein